MGSISFRRNYVCNACCLHLSPLQLTWVPAGQSGHRSGWEWGRWQLRQNSPDRCSMVGTDASVAGRRDTADLLIIGEEKSFVLPERAADGKTTLVALAVWFGVGSRD